MVKTYNGKYGSLFISPVDMDNIREVDTVRWEKDNPPPQPPEKEPEYYRENAEEMLAIKEELGLTRQQAISEWKKRQEPIPDKSDGQYIQEKRRYDISRFVFVANLVILRGVCVDGSGLTLIQCINKGGRLPKDIASAITKTKSDFGEFQLLYWAIVDISELTEQLVIRKIDELGYMWMGEPLLDIVRRGGIPKGNTSSTWKAMGYVAAKDVEHIGPYKFNRLSIEEQADIVAIYLTSSWLKSLEHEHAKAKADAKREQIKK